MTADIDPKVLGRRIRVRVEIIGTVDLAASRCGLPRPTFETYLYGKNLPGAGALLRLADGLGVSADWLLGRKE